MGDSVKPFARHCRNSVQVEGCLWAGGPAQDDPPAAGIAVSHNGSGTTASSHPFLIEAASVSRAFWSDADVGFSASLRSRRRRPPRRLLRPYWPAYRCRCTIVVAVVIVAALYFGREVLIPITIAFLLTFLLSPLVEWLRRLRLGRIPSVVLAVVLALAIIAGIGSAIGTQVAQLAQDIPEYQATIEKKIAAVRDTTLAPLNERIDSISHQLSGPPPNRPARNRRRLLPPTRRRSRLSSRFRSW